MTTPQRGMIVRDRAFGGIYTGTITKVSADGRWVTVTWHGTIADEDWPTEQVDILS